MKEEMKPEKLALRARNLAGNVAGSIEASAKIPTQISNTLDMLEMGELTFTGKLDVSDKTLDDLRLYIEVVLSNAISRIVPGLGTHMPDRHGAEGAWSAGVGNPRIHRGNSVGNIPSREDSEIKTCHE